MKLWQILLKIAGWKADITVPNRKKAIICVAPHTSNWDFIIGLIAYRSLGRKAGFLMKDFWFFFPLNYILKALGGIPVKKNTSQSLTAHLVEEFETRKDLVVAITPEGTRKPVENWRTGFIRIAYEAKIPIQLGVLDYKNKTVFILKEYFPSSDFGQDMKYIRNYYSRFKENAKYPEKFNP